MFSRARQIQLALLLPIGFLAARAIYAALFGGARSGSILLFELPSWNLLGPFAHISVLGPIYLDGLVTNLSTALPFAFFMLVAGLSVLLVKPRHLFDLAKKMPSFSALLTAIAIGWVQIPVLIQATSRISRAMKLRSEKRVRALLPILETAIGTSLAMAQRLALSRDNMGAGSSRLQITNLRIEKAKLGPIDLQLKPGDCLVISGPTGSGKSSLLLAATGFASELGLKVSGEIVAPERVGFVSQQAREQLFGPLVRDEIESTSNFGLDAKANVPVHQLSEGEAVQVSIVRELQKRPRLLILDEPFAGLDQDASNELVNMLARYQVEGGSLLIAEHRPELMATISTSTAHIFDGSLISGNYPQEPTKSTRKPSLLTSDLVLSFEKSSIGFGDMVLIERPKLQIRQSEIVAITGKNGAGKTSLLSAITDSSQIAVMVPELVSDFFVTTSLAEELVRADKIAKAEPGFTRSNLESILGQVPDSDIHPRDLSAGTQFALGIAMQLSRKPKVLLIDEPSKGLDPQTKAQVAATLECVRETGCAVVIATHDYELIEQLGAEVYEISNSELKRVGRVMA